MKLLSLMFKRETAAPMVALTLASAVSVLLVIARVAWSGNIRDGFLIWNLFLAWLPVIFALQACDEYRCERNSRWRLFAWAGAWLLFFPNAPYIFTDLIHLTNRFRQHVWVDMTLILLCAFTGMVLGFVSLYMMQSLVARRYGSFTGWLFVAGTAAASSFGVYIGRFLRFNSWDVIVRPASVYERMGAWFDGPFANRTSAAFLVLFATFSFVAYVLLYALTHLSPATLAVENQKLASA
jgi:uncharacterized membrane protein